MKIYICGPTNRELSSTLALFDRWEEILKRDLKDIPGIEIINPTKINTNLAWGDYLKERLDTLKKSDAVFVINGWNNSKAATSEFILAVEAKKPLYWEKHYLRIIDFCHDYSCLKS